MILGGVRVQLHSVKLASCLQPAPLDSMCDMGTGCMAACESSDGLQGAREGPDSAEGAASPREKSFSRSRSRDERPMWETWILREAWDKGSLEVEAVLMSPLQPGSPDLLPPAPLPSSAGCCEAEGTAWIAQGHVTAASQFSSGRNRCTDAVQSRLLPANPLCSSLLPCELASRHQQGHWPWPAALAACCEPPAAFQTVPA